MLSEIIEIFTAQRAKKHVDMALSNLNMQLELIFWQREAVKRETEKTIGTEGVDRIDSFIHDKGIEYMEKFEAMDRNELYSYGKAKIDEFRREKRMEKFEAMYG